MPHGWYVLKSGYLRDVLLFPESLLLLLCCCVVRLWPVLFCWPDDLFTVAEGLEEVRAGAAFWPAGLGADDLADTVACELRDGLLCRTVADLVTVWPCVPAEELRTVAA